MVEETIELSVAFQTVSMLTSWKNQSLKFLLTLTLMCQTMMLKLVVGPIRRILELAALKLLFAL